MQISCAADTHLGTWDVASGMLKRKGPLQARLAGRHELMMEGGEAMWDLWNDLPEALQHEVAVAVLHGHHAAPSHSSHAPTSSHGSDQEGLTNPKWGSARPHSTSCRPVAAVRGTCRQLRDSINAAATRLAVSIPASYRPNALRLHRFPCLSRLSISLYQQPSAAGSRTDHPQGVYLHDMQPSLRELRVAGDRGVGTVLSLPPTPMPGLTVLEMEWLPDLQFLDCGLFPGLKQLSIRECPGLRHLVRLGACGSSLQHLDLAWCCSLTAGLEPEALSQLSQLEHLDVTGTQLAGLDVTACSPALTHLDVSAVPDLKPVQLQLPDGTPRTALRFLGVRGSRCVPGSLLRNTPGPKGWSLNAAPNLETLDVSWQRALPRGFNLSAVPKLTHLIAKGAYLGGSGLDLTPVGNTLQVLDVSDTLLSAVDLSACSVLQQLRCTGCERLKSLDGLQRSGRATLTSIQATYCASLVVLDLGGCSALRDLDLTGASVAWLDLSAASSLTELHLSRCSQLQALDLSACTSLQVMAVNECGPEEMDVSACKSLLQVDAWNVHIVGAREGARVRQ